MKLSIAMIVKNEEKNLDRTLKVLLNLKDKLSYEIIIVDTGSTDNTIEIASRYTDKIYQHNWSGNFSEMRNISLGYCTGEWVLVLDADEVLIDTKEIVNFFESEESELFNSGTIEINNYDKSSKKVSTSARLKRLFRNSGNLKYTGKVHEQPPKKLPVAHTKIAVMHYGYDSNDYELMNYKFKRNTKLLKEELVTADGDYKIYILFQLSKSYSMAEKNDEALRYIKMAYDLEKKKKDNSIHTYVYHWYASMVFNAKNYEKTIQICKEVVKYCNKNLDIFYMMAISYSALDKYKEAYKYYDEYFKLRKERESGECNDDLSLSEGSFQYYEKMLSNRVVCYFKEKKYKKVIEEVENNPKVKSRKNIEEIYVRCCILTNNLNKVIKYYEECKIDDSDIQKMITELIDIDINNEVTNIEQVKNVFSSLDRRLKIYIDSMYSNVLVDIEEIDFSNYYEWKKRILEKFILKDISYLNLIRGNTDEIIKCYIAELCKNYECVDMLYDYTKKKFLTTDVLELNFISTIENVLVFNKSITEKKYKNLVLRSLVNKSSLRKKIYRNEVLEGNILRGILNEYDRFWLDIEEEIKVYYKDRLEYLNKINSIIKINDKYSKIIDVFLKEVSDEAISLEMIKEKERIYNIVEEFISSNKVNDAMELLVELEKIFKWDGKILSYKGLVCYVVGKFDEALLSLSLGNVVIGENFDSIFNIACVLEKQGRIDDCKKYYKDAYEICTDEDMKMQVRKILDGLK